MPDPSTLSEAGDDAPASPTRARTSIDRASSQRVAPPPQQPTRVPARPVADLIGGDSGPQRPSTTEPISRQPPPKAAAAPPRQTAPGDSLLGLDFLGGSSSAPPDRPASMSGAVPSAAPRTDLKQSILSLYASAPKPAQPQHQRGPSDSFGGFQSPPLTSPTQGSGSGSGLGDMNDAFSSLSFTSASSPPPQQAQPSAFANLTSATRQQPSSVSASSFGGGGSFFDPPAAKAPAPAAVQPPAPQRTQTQGSGFGDWFSATSPATTAPPLQPSNAFGSGGDLFDLSTPAQPTMAAPAPTPAAPKPSSDISSAFNLSQPSQVPQTQPKPSTAAAPASNIAADPWGSSDAWASSNASAPTPSAAAPKPAASNEFSGDTGGWGASPAAPKPAPQITQDDDFGGWSSAPAPSQPSVQQQPAKPSGGFSSNNEDLFSNVWE